MKKHISLIIALTLAVFALAACGGSAGDGNSAETSTSSVSVDLVDSLKTIGDVINLDKEEAQTAVYDGNVIYAFKYGDNYYRVRAEISPEDEQKYMDIDFSDEDYEAQQEAIVRPLEISEIETLNDQILSQEELDALVGKTGQELQDAGWTYGGHDLDTMEFWMNYGPFVYTVVFDGEVDEADYETFDDEAGTKDMVVKSAEYNSLGDATEIEP